MDGDAAVYFGFNLKRDANGKGIIPEFYYRENTELSDQVLCLSEKDENLQLLLNGFGFTNDFSVFDNITDTAVRAACYNKDSLLHL